MLKEQKSKELFDRIVSLRQISEIDPVESYSHALYGFLYVDSQVVCTKLIDGPDVYEIISTGIKKQIADQWHNIALYTEGWAAPPSKDNPDLPPSQHPEAKRVRLLCILSQDSDVIESIISLDKQDSVYDSSGQGKLADSLKQLRNFKEGYDNVNDNSFYI
jgi:hypothetical protein